MPKYHLQYSPIWHASLLSNSITPHVKPNSHDSASNKDDKNHEGTNQKIQESIKERAAMKMGDWGEEKEKHISSVTQAVTLDHMQCWNQIKGKESNPYLAPHFPTGLLPSDSLNFLWFESFF